MPRKTSRVSRGKLVVSRNKSCVSRRKLLVSRKTSCHTRRTLVVSRKTSICVSRRKLFVSRKTFVFPEGNYLRLERHFVLPEENSTFPEWTFLTHQDGEPNIRQLTIIMAAKQTLRFSGRLLAIKSPNNVKNPGKILRNKHFADPWKPVSGY